MSKAIVNDPNALTPTKEAEGARENSTLMSMVGGLVNQAREQWSKEMAAELQALQIPQREELGGVLETTEKVDHERQQFRFASPYDPLYRNYTEEERQVRNPDTDHWNAQWIRGTTMKDVGVVFEAEGKLRELHPTMYRATTAEGAAGASGALAAGSGGALLPRPLESVVLINRDRVSKMRMFASSFQMTRQTHTVPTAAAMTGYMTAESTTATAGESAFAGVQFTAVKAQVKAIATKEMLDDAAISLVNLYAERAGMALGALEETEFWQGGTISAGYDAEKYVEDTITELNYADIGQMYFGIGQQYRSNSAWYAASDVLQFMAGVVTANGVPLYNGLVDTPRPLTDDSTAQGTLYGRPVYEVGLPDGEIAFGDMRAGYMIGNRAGIEVATSEHTRFLFGEVVWLFTARFDGNNIDNGAAGATRQCQGITSAGVT